jgi:hypothetical protein
MGDCVKSCSGKGYGGCTSLLYWLSSLAQTGVAIAILVVLYDNLVQSFGNTNFCYLSNTLDMEVCNYTATLASVSLFATFVLGVLECVTCNACGCGQVFDAVFSVVAFAWWLTGALVVNKNINDANTANIAESGSRDAMQALVWTEMGLFAYTALIGILRVLGTCLPASKSKAPEPQPVQYVEA